MSSWAVLSMMGIYTVDPASLAYELVGPTFSEDHRPPSATVRGRTFTVTATDDSGTKPYIRHVRLNGHEHARNWIAFRDITDGGSLQFDLDTAPNPQWGSAAGDAPPSLSDVPPATR